MSNLGIFHNILNCSDEKVDLNFSEPLIVEKCDNEIVSLNNINFSNDRKNLKPKLDLSIMI